MIAALGLGVVIGVLLGLLGGGGSILAVPALVYGVGVPIAAAIPMSLIVVGVSAAAALIPRLRGGQINWRIAGIFGVTGAGAAFAGAAVNRLLDPRLVLAGFALLMVAAGIRMLTGGNRVGGDCALPEGGVNWRGCLPKSIAAGLAVGFLTGLFGVGGGFLIIPAFVLLLGLPMGSAVATSLAVIVINSAAGFVAHLGEAHLDPTITLAFAGTAVIGSLLAGRLAHRVSTARLQRWFAYLIFAVAAFVLVQVAVGGPS
ncbi:MAG: sulfite exporter TauE/SafE family protein [Pseudonocardia sp.]|uniref:sulfite exporter TauE/SafE family protein n=1 Tax=unclassified Pseudonocardia TaxID=2619320 RepID=UPI00086F9AAA|nr:MULTISPECIES: sulfite exporter TauE/SafE family protein [unclassified Pseudonocardia]MBN9109742.1 sulfite exporter TauE/SafE family protein [Pseudonocardia sp.]ODU26725.1 MAG: permease [Pseudonocardia sp. SCN 72-51]ODV09154.1 MAG: permease [Pseudonocardia sp. SCN 73-27]